MQPADLDRGGVLSPAEERRARRWPRRLALGLLAFVALLAALVGGAWAYLQSDAGEARVRALALGAVTDALQGKLEVGRISLSGTTVELRDLRLRTPEGETVATLARVRAHLALLPLLHHTIRIDSAELDRPVLTLERDARGLNLSRALAPTRASPSAPSQPSPWSVQVEGLTLKDGAVSFRQPEGTPREVALQSLGGGGSALLGGGADGALRADLALAGAMTSPLEGPVAVKLTARGEEGETRLTLELEGPGMALSAEAHSRGPESLDLKISSLSLFPNAVRAVVPDYPLQVPLRLQGTLAHNGNWNTVALQGQAGTARLTLEGTLDLAQLEVRGLKLHAEGVDLRQLTGKGEKTELSLDLQGGLKGRSLETLSGALTLRVPPSRVAGQPVGPLSLRARARDGQVTLEALQGQLPGGSFQGSGTLNTRTLDLQATVNATDLDALGRTLGPLTGSALPELSGSGRLTLHLRGPTRHPSLTAKGTVRALRSGENGVKGLALDVRVPDLRKPLETDASVSAAELSIGGQRLKDLVTRLETKGRRLIADLRTKGAAQITLHLEGLLDPGGEGVNVDTLLLSWPEERWRLDRPAHVTFAGERLEVAPLVLRSGAQRLFLEGRKVGARVNAHVAVGGLLLERLPSLLTRPYGLQGTLDAEVTARGRLARPSLTARVALQDGAAFGYSGLSLTLDGSYADDRATGTLSAAALGASANGTFDLPLEGLGKRRRGPVKVNLDLADRSLGELLCQLAKRPEAEALCRGGTPAATGSVSATLRIEGDAAAPQLALTVRGEKLETPQLPASELSLTVRTDERDALSATLELSALGGHAQASLATPLLLGEVLRHPPTVEGLQRLPVELSLKGTDLALTPLSRAGLLPRRVRGTLGFEGTVHGTALSPEGRLTARLGRARYLGSPPLALALEATATKTEVTAHLTANQAGRPLADLRAQLARGLSALRDPDRLGEVPFRLEATAGPVDLSDDAFSSRDQEAPEEQKLHGSLTLAVGASGTLARPRAEASLTLDDFAMGKAEPGHRPLAHGEATFRYLDAKATLRAALKGQAGGTLALDGHTTLDLSYPALRRGLTLGKAPLALALQARHFDLGFLSGLSPVVRKVGGVLEADATAGGTFTRPTWRGALEWKDGVLNLTGLGEYHDVHLALNAVNDQLDLTDLSAQAGGGKLTLSASAHRAGDRWRMKGQAEAAAFPVVSDDQLVATATLRSTFDGEITRKLVNVQHLHVPEAHFELPQVARKDLQSLQRPEDVVLLREGRMVDRSQRRDPTLRADLRTVLGKSAQIAPVQAEAEPGLEYWVTVDAPRNVWIRGEDVNAEIGLSEGFRVEYGQKPLLYGEVRVIRARLEVLGRRFDLRNDSSVRFAGEVLQPFVNVTGVYKNEPAQVTVYLTIRGQGKDVSLHVSSDPPLSESQIYTLLATGRITLKRGSGAAMSGGQAASIIGSLAASQLKKSLASKLPLDVLSIEAGEEGLQGSKLEAGTYVTDKIYVGYTGRLGADRSKGENANAVKLEYQVSPHWSLEVEYGDARAGGADLIWSKDY